MVAPSRDSRQVPAADKSDGSVYELRATEINRGREKFCVLKY